MSARRSNHAEINDIKATFFLRDGSEFCVNNETWVMWTQESTDEKCKRRFTITRYFVHGASYKAERVVSFSGYVSSPTKHGLLQWTVNNLLGREEPFARFVLVLLPAQHGSTFIGQQLVIQTNFSLAVSWGICLLSFLCDD